VEGGGKGKKGIKKKKEEGGVRKFHTFHALLG